ncbi:Chromate transporter [Paenibacillus vortex V453]|jgi:chromate transporter|uniref:Chromate transporter n=2 Tax=Paenibacillus TaxID=44249 RepID=A0A163JVT3_9BACL|nr:MULTISPECIES: chromate transporter [Paenibacillus]ANA80817.1 chromate transporter [Paenibacillus glucanolyticus]AVV55110.1 chromate transporter [Paenibacillus glucanolyticus]AWP29700.1 chromate transporter [Paenibacillus sp. Cedars]EFU42782.1 Chromate transporter [Paenibacillus vortex V453]ETT40525.1 Chromate transporter [Paenibacillus sp. FSL R5-808]
MYWDLFIMFISVGLVSFGGGYAVIPMIQYEVTEKGWLTAAEFQQTVALAGMAPGSIATNAATLIGYETAGYLGAAVSTAGIIIPSLIVVVLLSAFFYRLHDNPWLKSSLYGLRPVTTGLILYAAIHFGLSNEGAAITWGIVPTLLISGVCLYLLLKHKLHPLLLLIVAGAAGIVLF